MRYAKVIIDISAQSVDKAFTYVIPEDIEDIVNVGSRVQVPFGSHNVLREGFITGISEECDIEASRLKKILSAADGKTDVNGELIKLAAFMAGEYGCTMNQALTAVLPVKRAVRKNSRRRDPLSTLSDGVDGENLCLSLNRDQENAVSGILRADRPSLLYGVTGSGKTRVYIELIKKMREMGKQTIVLIPEISLTYQTVRELVKYLGNSIAVMHSKLSEGEKYEQYKKALNGEIDVMVGPRSAVFTPFSRLGLIIIDEEHERTYRSDTSPRYDTRAVAMWRTRYNQAKLILGSATPSVESYKAALKGSFGLFKLKERAHRDALLPKVHIVDMRKELKSGNRSIFSSELAGLMYDRLNKNEQVMLFLNRRGYAGFVSCRSCGHVIKCPHCDVSMTVHNSWYRDSLSGRKYPLLSCHYCGYAAPLPSLCPECGSRFIAPFGAGTEKLESLIREKLPSAKVLRMDADTTAKKGQYEKILSAFRARKADILIGTQMIVKGHDFPFVTLVGIVSADLSLNTSEYDASERTFQLITQAAGRSGRADIRGDVVIQSYDPSHYAIACAAAQDYESFYEREMSYRSLMKYPPETRMLFYSLKSMDEDMLNEAAGFAADIVKSLGLPATSVIGPCNESVYKINDYYRKILYIKHSRHDIIIRIRNELNKRISERFSPRKLYLTSDIR